MKTLVVLFTLLSANCAFVQNKGAQPKIDYWKILSKVKFNAIQDTTGEVSYKVIFTEQIETLNGQEIQLEGFLSSKTNIGSLFLLNYPFEMVLCGGGTESIVHLQPTTIFEITDEITKKPYLWQGTLELNSTDPMKLPYTLKNAKLISKPN